MIQKDVQYQLGMIEAKLDILIEETRDQKKRVGHLERKVYTWSGGMAILIIVWGAVSDKVYAVLGVR